MSLPDQPATPTETGPTATPAPSPTPLPQPRGRAVLPDDQQFDLGPRIAIQDSNGQIFTVLGDGSNAVPLTNPGEGTFNSLPTWSSDASHLAWASRDPNGGSATVRSARFDGTDWAEQAVPSDPIYLAWDPSGSQIGTLGPTGPVLELGVISLPDQSYVAVDEGAPFWFSWSPDADGFLVHASGLRLDFVPINGPPQVLEQFPGSFQAPQWLDGAVQLIYADQVGGQDFLVAAGADGRGRRALVSYDGYLQFATAPATGQIAMYVIDPALVPGAGVVTASHQQDDFVDIIDPINRNELTVIATFGGDPFVLYPGPRDNDPSPVVAFYWSPDGNSLAWLLLVDPGDGDCRSETAVYEWQFFQDGRISVGPQFFPTATFACNYASFFDQLSQANSFWSPDGTVLTYAGTDRTTGERGIWNVLAGSLADPVLIADGEIAVWSSDAAGSAASSSL